MPPVPGQKVDTPLTSAPAATPADMPLSWAKTDIAILPPEDLGPTVLGDPDYCGTYVVYNWDSREVVWEANWGNMLVTPAGHCFADGYLWISDLEAGSIFQIDVNEHPGKILRRIPTLTSTISTALSERSAVCWLLRAARTPSSS